MDITAKQKMFADEYIIDLDPIRAYIKVYKCKESTAKVNAYRLLDNASISLYIASKTKQICDKLDIKAEKVLQEIASIAFDDISNYLDFRTEKVQIGIEDNKPIYEYRTIADIKDSKTIDTKNISEISIGKDGQFKFKLYCRDEALIQLGKHLKLFTDKVEHSGEIKMPTIVITK